MGKTLEVILSTPYVICNSILIINDTAYLIAIQNPVTSIFHAISSTWAFAQHGNS